MQRKKLITVAALAVLALACGDAVGGMMQDAGAMLADAGDVIRDAGDAMQDAGDVMQPDAGAQDVSASCNKSETHPEAEGYKYYWAEFPINEPGITEVTVCNHGDPDSLHYQKADWCSRRIATWLDGTSTGVVYCGSENPSNPYTPPKSITVHN